jgi:two-component system chemotaxis response regulator CheY
MKVLVVDDSSMIRRLIKNNLSQAGYDDVLEAANGEEAVEHSKDSGVGLILMDWNMPKVTGLEAVQAIRASGNKTPIVMVTTESEKGHVVEAIKAGINDYLVKPFTAEALIERVKKFES